MSGPVARADCKYAAFYCEENVWWLLQNSQLKPGERFAVFISNVNRTCALWNQGASAPDSPVIWDYHVVVAVKDKLQCWIYDLDSRVGFPVLASDYLQATFPCQDIDTRFLPRFRVVSAADMGQHFVSDRVHMLDAGDYLQPPPSWPPIGTGDSNLMAFVDTEASFFGEVLDLTVFTQRYG